MKTPSLRSSAFAVTVIRGNGAADGAVAFCASARGIAASIIASGEAINAQRNSFN
jgi:hypothetical protein